MKQEWAYLVWISSKHEHVLPVCCWKQHTSINLGSYAYPMTRGCMLDLFSAYYYWRMLMRQKKSNTAHQPLFSSCIVLDWMLADALCTSIPESGTLKAWAQYMHSWALRCTSVCIVQQCWHHKSFSQLLREWVHTITRVKPGASVFGSMGSIVYLPKLCLSGFKRLSGFANLSFSTKCCILSVTIHINYACTQVQIKCNR